MSRLLAVAAAIAAIVLARRHLHRRLVFLGSARLTGSSQHTRSSDGREVFDTPGPFPLLPITKPATLQACLALPLDCPTVFICSYPKSGTTWLQNIVYEIATRGRRPLDHISNYCPFLENDQIWEHTRGAPSALAPAYSTAHAEIGLRIFNTHLLWEMLPGAAGESLTERRSSARNRSQGGGGGERDSAEGVEPPRFGKFIYIVRSPSDVCASFYQHLSHQAPDDGGYVGGVDSFVRDWCAGEVAFGKWTDHLASWLKPGPCFHDARTAPSTTVGHSPRVLVLSYEFLKSDLRSACRAIAEHLELELGEEELEAILPRLGFDYMKEHVAKFEPKSVAWLDKGDGFQFVRSGRVGDGAAVFGGDDHAERHFRLLLGPNGERVPACCRGLSYWKQRCGQAPAQL